MQLLQATPFGVQLRLFQLNTDLHLLDVSFVRLESSELVLI